MINNIKYKPFCEDGDILHQIFVVNITRIDGHGLIEEYDDDFEFSLHWWDECHIDEK